MDLLRFVVTGGGTGGHIYPALAIAKGLKDRHPEAEVLYIGTARGMEADIVPKEGFSFKGIAAAGLERRLSLKNLLVLWQAGKGFIQAGRIIRTWRPDIVIGTGGYVCGPVVMSAVLMGIPTLIHEQNAFPGITNRILSLFVNRVAVTFAGSEKYFKNQDKLTLTGLPVRPQVLEVDRLSGLKKLGLEGSRFLLLSFGGSRGARTINKAMVEVIKMYAGVPGMKILHVTGSLGHAEFLDDLAAAGIDLVKADNVMIVSYLYNMQDALAAADLVISRAGAATLAELTVLGIPSILIPYPYASENHQEFNARALEKESAAVVVLDRSLNGKILCRKISDLLNDPDGLSAMASSSRKIGKRDALEDIIDCVDELVLKRKK